MSLVEHAERELAIAGLAGSDEYDGMLYAAVVELVKKFADQGHSGASAAMAIGLVEKLLRFEPLTPLTGDDTEWNEVGLDTTGREMYQNSRYSSVFKDGEGGSPYDISAALVRDPRGNTWNSNVRLPIAFPYTPKTEVIDIDQHGRTLDRSLSVYDVKGFCEDDGCHCWDGGEKIKLDGDSHLSDEEKEAGLDGK